MPTARRSSNISKGTPGKRSDHCIICKKVVKNAVGVRGRPKRYCSYACAAKAKETDQRFCQVCTEPYFDERATDTGRSPSKCVRCREEGKRNGKMKQCSLCRKVFTKTASRHLFCSKECREQGVGPRPQCANPTCTRPVAAAHALGSWEAYCGVQHKHFAMGETTKSPNAQMNRLYRLWDSDGRKGPPPLDVWGKPWLTGADSQDVIKQSQLPKVYRERIATMLKIIAYMSDRTNWDLLEDPKDNVTTLNSGDWCWMIGASWQENNMWPLIPFVWYSIPPVLHRYLNAALTSTVRSPGYKALTPANMSAKQALYEEESHRLECLTDIQRRSKTAQQLEKRVDRYQRFFEDVEKGRVYPCITDILIRGYLPIPDEHARLETVVLRDLYRTRNRKIWKAIE